MEFADLLRAKRKELGLTIAQCAALLHKTQPAWTLYETGKRLPKLDEFMEICRILQTTPNQLLGFIANDMQPSIRTGSGSTVAIGGGNVSVVNGAPLPKVVPGESSACRGCPHRKKLAALEKLLSK